MSPYLWTTLFYCLIERDRALSSELLPEGYENFELDELSALADSLTEKVQEIRAEIEKPTKQDLENLKALVEARKSVKELMTDINDRAAEFAALLAEDEAEVEVEEVADETVVEAEVAEEVAEDAADVIETETAEEAVEVAETETAEAVETEAVEAEVEAEAVETEVVEAEVEVEATEPEAVEAEAVETEVAESDEVVEAEVEAVEAEVAEEAIPEEKIVVAETEVEVVDTIEDPAEEAELTNTPEEQNMSEVEGALEKPEFSIGGLAAAPKSNVMATGGAYTKGAGESFESVGDMAQELIAQYKHGGGDRGWCACNVSLSLAVVAMLTKQTMI